MVADRHYTPGPATHADLLAHMVRTGASRVVIVQPSFYGTDNRCMVESLRRLNGAGRGVAVVDETFTDADLQALADAGVRGVRINLESAGVQDPQLIGQALTYWADRIAPLGWHVQVYASLDALAAAVPHISALAVPIVLDHFAMVPDSTPLNDPRLALLLTLVREGKAWVKLSAPYRITQAGDEKRDAVTALAQVFLQANPERVVWASDWPHTNREPGKGKLEVSAYRDIAAAKLVSDVSAWLPTQAMRQQVLVDNPTRLYW